jgi:glycosyltransferase involved in cell wall biosynthesis
VLAAEIGGLGELVVHGETGVLVPSGEAEPLAQALIELARDPERRRTMGEAGRRRALEQFAERRNVDRTELLYREFLNGRLPQS